MASMKYEVRSMKEIGIGMLVSTTVLGPVIPA